MALRFPRLVPIEQQLYARRLPELGRHISRQFGLARFSATKRGRIAIAVGSRGIASLPAIVSAVVDEVKRAGGRPFLVPAMGSHGGATPEGQLGVLASLGVTADSVGAPIRSSFAVVQLGRTGHGLPVYLGRVAAEADGIIVINRIKEHTDFSGEYESGLVKMLAVGLGKHKGAVAMHSRQARSLEEDVPEAARIILAKAPVKLGLAVLENGYQEVADIVALRPGEILEEEKRLLRLVRRRAPRIPFREAEVLIVERMGKEISGVGLDTHVIARRRIAGEREFRGIKVRMLVVLDLSEASHGNAIGLGLADLATRRLLEKVDWEVTRTNVIHTGWFERAKAPLWLETDREAIWAALTSGTRRRPEEARVIRIADTLRLSRLEISEALLAEARGNPKVRILGRPRAMAFDSAGELL